MWEMVSNEIFAFSSYLTRMSTSLSGVSSPLENDPNSHAFKTGCVLKYWAINSLIACVLMVLMVVFDGKNNFFSSIGLHIAPFFYFCHRIGFGQSIHIERSVMLVL